MTAVSIGSAAFGSGLVLCGSVRNRRRDPGRLRRKVARLTVGKASRQRGACSAHPRREVARPLRRRVRSASLSIRATVGSREFLKDSKTEEMRPEVPKLSRWIGTVGHLARMIVFGLVGVF